MATTQPDATGVQVVALQPLLDGRYVDLRPIEKPNKRFFTMLGALIHAVDACEPGPFKDGRAPIGLHDRAAAAAA